MYFHEAILMEQGIADLESKQFKVLSMDENHLHLFDEICSRSLDRARIFSFDNEDRNWVFVCIEGQTYLGEALAKYDYWCYRMSDLCIYIPRLSHIIKRIDYAQWLEKDWCLNPDKENILNRLARKCGVTRDQFLTRYCTKPEGANIRILYLDISGDMDR